MESETVTGEENPHRWVLIRDLLVFQCKLIVDSFRDLVLFPLSLIAGLIGIVGGGPKSGSEFYDVLELGRRSERWIDLFGAVDRTYGPMEEDNESATAKFDDMVSRVELFLVDEYRKGGTTAQAKLRLDDALDSLKRVRKRHNAGERGEPEPSE